MEMLLVLAGGQAAHDVQVYRSKMLSEASEEHCRTVQLLEVPLNTETNDIVASVKANLLWQRHQRTWRGGSIRLLVLSVTALAEGSQPFKKPAGIGAVLNPFQKRAKAMLLLCQESDVCIFNLGFSEKVMQAADAYINSCISDQNSQVSKVPWWFKRLLLTYNEELF